MKKITNSGLFVASLVLAIAFALPAAFAKAETESQVDINQNQAEVNRNQAEVNRNQADLNRNQEDVNQNQEDVNEEQADVNENKAGDELNGASHRSAVATFVQNLLKAADREQGGIGDQVRAIANEQNDSKDDVADEIEQVKNRSGFKTFLIGTDYKNIGQLRSEMAKTENQIDQLTQLSEQTADAAAQADLQAQIQALKDHQQKINDFIKANESKFSLFGWFVKLFSK